MHEQKTLKLMILLHVTSILTEKGNKELCQLWETITAILPVANFPLSRNIDKVSELTSGIVMRDTTLHLAQKTMILLRYFSTKALQTYQL